MATNTIKTIIKNAVKSHQAWDASNPILEAGQVVYSVDKGYLIIVHTHLVFLLGLKPAQNLHTPLQKLGLLEQPQHLVRLLYLMVQQVKLKALDILLQNQSHLMQCLQILNIV